MEQYFSLSKVIPIQKTTKMLDKDRLEIIQISDMHLFAEPDGSLLGVNTRASFLATLDLIQSTIASPDLVVVTGDISQDLSEESYAFFRKAMLQFNCPILCLSGNHDEFDALERQTDSGQIITDKHYELEHWQIFLAHSQVKGKVHGVISQEEMHWLNSKLNDNEKPTLIFTHHHPVFSNTTWIDSIGIKNCEEFTELLAKHSHVKVCGFGHVHQELAIKQDHINYYSVPSTCVQFKKNSEEFAVSDELPGFRIYHCYPNGQVDTKVYRVDNFDLNLDKTAAGY